jgi:hypothetical protein
MDFFLLFIILDHVCTTRFFCNYFWKIFSKSFANSQRYMIKIARSIYKILKFRPLFQMLFLWLNKTPPVRNSLLRVQEGFNRYQFLKNIPLNISIRYQFKKIWNIIKIRWWCGPFSLGLILSPPLALIAKNEDFESPIYFLPIGTSR